MSEFSTRLYELRAEAGLSQKEAAAALGVSQALLSHYEKGIREFGLDFLCRAADFYGVTADYILSRSDSRTGLDSSFLEDISEDSKFSPSTIYRAAIMTHERMSAGSNAAGEKADMLYAASIYKTLFAAAQKGYIPKRWFTLPPKYALIFPNALSELILSDFPDKNTNARRYGGPEPKCIETVIGKIEEIIKKTGQGMGTRD